MRILDLITNRTAADVALVERLSRKGWSNMTAEEQGQYLSALKGAYNAADLNRVGSAVAYLNERLTTAGYALHVYPKLDWQIDDYPTQALLTTYLDNVRTLRGVFASYLAEVPQDMQQLTWQEANTIEQILVDLDFLLTQMSLAWFYSGEIQGGEV